MSKRPNYNSITMQRCKHLLNEAYNLQDEGIEAEAIMRMAIFISVVFAENSNLTPDEYIDIIQDTWERMYKVIDDTKSDSTIWVSTEPITEEEQ
tara:strand:+ start:7424 stop:7705 length:282 start_codon:yes stop_codon:yes gene_type:complete